MLEIPTTKNQRCNKLDNNLEEMHELLKKKLKFQEDRHRKNFVYITQESAYLASCATIESTYKDLVEVGRELGILYPTRMLQPKA